MDTLTYSIIIGIVFFAGIFVFTYFETPRETINKGIKKLKNITILKLERGNKSLSIPLNKKESGKKNNGDMNMYVHEY